MAQQGYNKEWMNAPFNNGGYQNRGYQNRGYQNRGGYYPQQNQKPPKKSGAKYSIIRKGKFEGLTIVNAWNKSKGKGLITAKVSPYKDSSEYTAKTTGKKYITMIAEVVWTNSGQVRIIPCSMNIATKVISLPDLGMVITPNGNGLTSSGKKVTGYFGKFTR
ncbi:hypothetical protein BUL40_15595 [Croceivirga radicis]|uniref:Uncharacterized protein n=1 Tax=Croceivirga radicis TaxID=1929488 RepID=A0A1V6LMU2_9FLAO|nr:hypothetical protein [Croceivirga radicis]OQD41500.1 hypothetical protein BUL40_15595 [Croceivirga radicis]